MAEKCVIIIAELSGKTIFLLISNIKIIMIINNFRLHKHTHGVMFHHFHSNNHPIRQGSLSVTQFCEMLDWLTERYSLLSAEEYHYKLLNKSLKNEDICLTFDDALLCQVEIASPILKERDIHAFFFVYSSPMMGNPDFLEIYSYFRATAFPSVDDFYEEFCNEMQSQFSSKYAKAEKQYNSDKYLKDSPFYSSNDKWFRYLRDDVLEKEKYDQIMHFLLKKHNFNPQYVMDKLWMNSTHIKKLRHEGHIIGLHSYSHPTMLHTLPIEKQAEEYQKNIEYLIELLQEAPVAMSHPCGKYTQDTLKILSDKGITIGFRANMAVAYIKSNLEVPRIDHAIILAEMSR